jgi:hypothetical protein
LVCLLVWIFETGPHYVAQGGIKLTMQPMLALNLQSSCLSLPSARITSMYHHAWPEEKTVFEKQLIDQNPFLSCIAIPVMCPAYHKARGLLLLHKYQTMCFESNTNREYIISRN